MVAASHHCTGSEQHHKYTENRIEKAYAETRLNMHTNCSFEVGFLRGFGTNTEVPIHESPTDKVRNLHNAQSTAN